MFVGTLCPILEYLGSCPGSGFQFHLPNNADPGRQQATVSRSLPPMSCGRPRLSSQLSIQFVLSLTFVFGEWISWWEPAYFLFSLFSFSTHFFLLYLLPSFHPFLLSHTIQCRNKWTKYNFTKITYPYLRKYSHCKFLSIPTFPCCSDEFFLSLTIGFPSCRTSYEWNSAKYRHIIFWGKFIITSVM